MELIIGGACQGKAAYARSRHPGIVFKRGGEITMEELFCAEGVLDFQEFIRRMLSEEGEGPGALPALAAKIHELNPDLVLVCREVGLGVVPVSRQERVYREAVGRFCTDLAHYCQRVERVICGIGQVIKGGEEV